MKKIILILCVYIFSVSSLFAANPTDTQLRIGNMSWDTRSIPDTVINSFNANNTRNLPLWTTIGEAYDAGFLSDGSNGDITNYVDGLPDNFSASWNCGYVGGSIWNALDNCLNKTALVNGADAYIETGVKQKIISWTVNLARFFSLLAVGAVVYGGLLMTLSWWDDEKIKKWKEIVKWALLWFLWIVVAGWLVKVLIELIFALWE